MSTTTSSRRRRSTKKKSSKQQQQAPLKDWSNLPLDILGSIASRLLVTEETIFRSVCKNWQSTPNCRSLPSEPDFSDPICPWLFYFPGNTTTSRCTVFNPLCGKSFDLVFPSELAGYRIHSHNDGWLLMELHRFRNLLLFNPLTRQVIDEIPEVPCRGFPNISFTSPSASQECTLVGFDNYGMVGLVGIWKRGNPEWECYDVEEWPFTFYQSDCCMISHGNNNKIYYSLGATGSIATFHVNNPQQTWAIWDIPLQYPNSNSKVPTFYHPSYLVEGNGGALLGVFESVNEGRIRVLRLNRKQHLWEEVKHLGNQMLFVSNGRCFSQQTRKKNLRNKIFLPKYEPDTHTYVFYCLATNKFASFNGKVSSPIARGFTDYQQSCWFRPATTVLAR